MRSGWRLGVLIGVLLLAIAIVFSQPRLAQWREYHQMADTRAVLGIPNALNVLSNVPFAVIGLVGLCALFRGGGVKSNRRSYAVFFAGVTLTALGSSYYHLAPDNFRLVWDRFPMTVAFMALVTAVIGMHIDEPAARRLLMPLVSVGAASVFYWYWSELRGAGDLRFYGVVQFGSLAAIAAILILYPRPRRGYLVAGLLAYGLSKLCEILDAQIFSSTQLVSGHTLKHLAAAAGAACVLPFTREPSAAPPK